jgi:hypothetical protein
MGNDVGRPNRAYSGKLGNPVPASVLRRGVAISVFRCDHCGRWMDEKWRVEYDGMWVCRLYCMTLTTPSELDLLWADQQAQVDSFDSHERPVGATGQGIIGINSRSPDVLTIGNSSTAAFTITGFGLSSADTIAYEVPELTTSTAVYTGTTGLVLTVQSTACPNGDYWWSYGGTKYYLGLKVR